jgi:hypothetical protein
MATIQEIKGVLESNNRVLLERADKTEAGLSKLFEQISLNYQLTEDRFKAQDARIDQALAEMKSQHTALEKEVKEMRSTLRAEPPTKKQKGDADIPMDPWAGQNLGMPPSSSAASASTRHSSAPPERDSKGEPVLVEVTGFHGQALVRVQKKYYEECLLPLLPPRLMTMVSFRPRGGGYSSSFYLQLPGRKEASEVIELLRNKMPNWTDPGTSQDFKVKVVFQRTAAQRKMGFYLSKAFQFTLPLVSDQELWKAGGYRMGTNIAKHTLYAHSDAGAMVELIRIEFEDDRPKATTLSSATRFLGQPALAALATRVTEAILA